MLKHHPKSFGSIKLGVEIKSFGAQGLRCHIALACCITTIKTGTKGKLKPSKQNIGAQMPPETAQRPLCSTQETW